MSATSYLDGLAFEADSFQRRAAHAIDRGASVVVTAPTGSGKTVVAEAAIALALASGKRAIYTTPLKALSNQKYGDFRQSHGDDAVGLLTGDNSINGSAGIVVMTTEVLRNMMYADSPDLEDVGVVILDEVHYLQDRARGGVWEEIIIHLDQEIPLVCLSATVANPEELRDWVADRRGDTELVLERERPVPLESTYLLRDKFDRSALRLMPVFHGDRPNERVARMLRFSRRNPGHGHDSGRDQRYAAPRRHETCELLRRRGLLPAIYFIFSRQGCESAAKTVVDRGLSLTSRSEADEIEDVARAATAHLGPEDLLVLGFERWLEGLRAGVGPHHAGMVPAMKETVEQLFSRGLIKLVFATETLALGINMPARTVVIESLSKFTGESHELLQPGDYTQLTGRAGRRGIDSEGTAVVLHSPHVGFDRVAAIAGRGSHPLRSSFRPNYNMTVNLVATYPQDEAEKLLDSSFAQFSDRIRAVKAADDLRREEEQLEKLRASAEHPDVDVWEMADRPPISKERVMAEFTSATSAGDVLEWFEHGRRRRFVVLARGQGKRPRLLTVSDGGESRRLAPGKLPESVERIGHLDLPKPMKTRETKYLKRVSEVLNRWSPDGTPPTAAFTDQEVPIHLLPYVRAAQEARRLEGRIETRRRRVARLSSGLVPHMRAITVLLRRLGYVRDWQLTDKGQRLRRIYNELDILLSESLDADLFKDLNGPETVALASLFTYEPRRSDSQDVGAPSLRLAQRAESVMQLWDEISDAEERAGLDAMRPPEPGFLSLAHDWVDGASLGDLFGDDSPGVGDFVRNCRQLIDLLRQIDEAAPEASPGVRAGLAGLDRGVVAAAGAV